MRIESAARPFESEAPAGTSELAEGLMLLRATSLKMIRLQLAIERHDRRVALEAVDGLVALDRRLQDYLETLPATGEQLMFRHDLDSERAALNEEKLTLAAEVIRKPEITMKRADLEEIDPGTGPEDDWIGATDLPSSPEQPRRRWLLAAVPLLLSGLAAVAYYTVPDAAAWLGAVAGVVR